MNDVSRFEPIGAGDSGLVAIDFDGQTIMAPAGGNLAAALLAGGVVDFRATPVTGAPRGPYCMMGACYDCLVEVDGVSVQACMVTVRAGLEVRRVARPVDGDDAQG